MVLLSEKCCFESSRLLTGPCGSPPPSKATTGIRAENRTRLVPVVILTSSSEDRDLTNAYHLGANGYVVKPIEFDALTGTIQQLGMYWLTINRSPPLSDDDARATRPVPPR